LRGGAVGVGRAVFGGYGPVVIIAADDDAVRHGVSLFERRNSAPVGFEAVVEIEFGSVVSPSDVAAIERFGE